MPRVSIIIPAFNAMRYLPDTLNSVLRQTFTDYEVLIINDGSSDYIAEWAAQISDSRVRLISQANQGLAGARNTGIDQAYGEYFAFLDADDLWLPSKLEKQVRYLDENPKVGLVDTWVALADEHGIPTGRAVKTNAEGNVLKQILESPTVICGSSPLVRRCCFETAGVFARDLSGSADWDLWIRVALQYPFAMVKEALVYYRQHSSNMSKNCLDMLKDNSAVIERAFQKVPAELQYLKNRSYARVNLYLAWRALDNGNYEEAIYFRQQALKQYPELLYTREAIRQKIALLVSGWLGSEGYEETRSFIRNLRQRVLLRNS